MATKFVVMDEQSARAALGTCSINMYVYAVTGDRVSEVVDWVAGQSLSMEMVVHHDRGAIRAAYVMFGRAAYSDKDVRAINSAVSLFRQAWKGIGGIDWGKDRELVHARRA